MTAIAWWVWALPAAAQEALVHLEYRVVGTQLRVAPAALSVPKGEGPARLRREEGRRQQA